MLRAAVRLGAGAAIAAIMLISAHGAAAWGSYVKFDHYAGRASETFEFTYTLNRLAGDPVCPEKTEVALTWDDIALGSVPMDCATLSATGVVTPPAAANDLGRHQFCIENAGSGPPLLCYTYTIIPEPGECDPTGNWSPPCAVATYATFEPDCIPNTQPSPPCVTVTPIPIVCDTTGLGPSPPCADTPVPPPTSTPDVAIQTPEPTTATPTPAPSSTPTVSPTATRTITRVCDERTTPQAGGCVTATPTSGSDVGDGGVSVNWTAVIIAAGAVAATGGAAGGVWLFLRRA